MDCCSNVSNELISMVPYFPQPKVLEGPLTETFIVLPTVRSSRV